MIGNATRSMDKEERKGILRTIADTEGVSLEFLQERLDRGRIVVMQRHGKPPIGIGEGLRTKVNANIGTSAELSSQEQEVEKAIIAERYGADTVTDLSMGGDLDRIRKAIADVTNTPLTTVPIYQTVVEKGSFKAISGTDLVQMVKKHTDEGISSIVIHAGFTLEMLEDLRGVGRIMGMVSKGGSFTSAWMLENQKENPFLDNFDQICSILEKRDVVLSLGNTMRSGCVHDQMDMAQEKEMDLNAELAIRANDLGVQVIIEGMGGHVSPDRISGLVQRYKKRTGHRPLFVAGPLPIEIGVGYDHISGSVGGAMAAGAGADYLCYITPSEHLALPNAQQVREGIVAFRIAAHIGDTLKYGPRPQDKALAEFRRIRDWDNQFRLAIDGERARDIHPQTGSRTCSMCGRFCAIAIMEEYLG